MSCHYDMDFLGIPNVDLSKWKAKDDGKYIRLKNVEEIVQDTNLIWIIDDFLFIAYSCTMIQSN